MPLFNLEMLNQECQLGLRMEVHDEKDPKSQHSLLKFDCYFFQGVPEKFLYVYVFFGFLIIVAGRRPAAVALCVFMGDYDVIFYATESQCNAFSLGIINQSL